MQTDERQEQPIVAHSIVDEIDTYTNALGGVRVEAIRTGLGTGPNRVTVVQDRRLTLTSSDVEIPVLSHTTVGDDKIVVVNIRAAPKGARWCEIDLTEGAVIAYGSSSEHTAITVPGLAFTYIVTDRDQLAAAAEDLRIKFAPPPSGQVHELVRSSRTSALATAMSQLPIAAEHRVDRYDARAADVINAMADALSIEERVTRIGCRRGIDGRRIVTCCIDHADEIGRMPSIAELCVVAGVSERTLRVAFTQEYDLPPSLFFRAWALDEARRRLLRNDLRQENVTAIATDLGFFHLGRFAGHYRRHFGEPPSATLRAS
ncbi:MAG: helix-turn-helix domain-containing protein [Acidimicrobiia bacterium]|nr:helix-turn-helix domain-containing protein [Acidimicrobiia bacterium]